MQQSRTSFFFFLLASGQYRPKFPSPYLQKEIFVLNLEDGFFGCQVNESTEVLQLFELSQLCDGVPQCFQGSDELARDLKCTDRMPRRKQEGLPLLHALPLKNKRRHLGHQRGAATANKRRAESSTTGDDPFTGPHGLQDFHHVLVLLDLSVVTFGTILKVCPEKEYLWLRDRRGRGRRGGAQLFRTPFAAATSLGMRSRRENGTEKAKKEFSVGGVAHACFSRCCGVFSAISPCCALVWRKLDRDVVRNTTRRSFDLK
ncbi:hypothetical protein HPB48_001786 [Haemaphysalis longicornis]|uniref:Uncharacterized protein n=1 Tax=Haemaphysalis longicornis TaxID=44386 RepID=A0A9J6GQV3_HAELO|nr:hypothetical protein HPB48_001786 [Haemaphysalis longicornis]